jgi:hypothetical protein
MSSIFKFCIFFHVVVDSTRDPKLLDLVNPAIVNGYCQAVDLWYTTPNTKANIFGRYRAFLKFIVVCTKTCIFLFVCFD